MFSRTRTVPISMRSTHLLNIIRGTQDSNRPGSELASTLAISCSSSSLLKICDCLLVFCMISFLACTAHTYAANEKPNSSSIPDRTHRSQSSDKLSAFPVTRRFQGLPDAWLVSFHMDFPTLCSNCSPLVVDGWKQGGLNVLNAPCSTSNPYSNGNC
jgi:hypothetical protein